MEYQAKQEMSVRLFRTLVAHVGAVGDETSVADLVARSGIASEADFLRIPNAGRKQLAEYKEILREHGLPPLGSPPRPLGLVQSPYHWFVTPDVRYG